MSARKLHLVAAALPVLAAPSCLLVCAALMPIARAALTPAMTEAFQHGTNVGHVVICNGRVGCTNPAHLHFYRRGNGTNDQADSGGSVGIRTKH
jgi:hypothetical protein